MALEELLVPATEGRERARDVLQPRRLNLERRKKRRQVEAAGEQQAGPVEYQRPRRPHATLGFCPAARWGRARAVGRFIGRSGRGKASARKAAAHACVSLHATSGLGALNW